MNIQLSTYTLLATLLLVGTACQKPYEVNIAITSPATDNATFDRGSAVPVAVTFSSSGQLDGITVVVSLEDNPDSIIRQWRAHQHTNEIIFRDTLRPVVTRRTGFVIFAKARRDPDANIVAQTQRTFYIN